LNNSPELNLLFASELIALDINNPNSPSNSLISFELLSCSDLSRISELDLNPDRADVIIPAAKIYLRAMKWSNARKIYVPKIGLSDGIIKSLYIGKFD
jgi:exopolyphosphatase/pppGpp-phosphohydrolase